MSEFAQGGGKKDSKAGTGNGPSVEEQVPGQTETGSEREGPAATEASSEGKNETHAETAPGPDESQGEPETESSEAEAGAEGRPLSLEERVEQLVKENAELEDRYVRLMADFDNFRKRARKDKSDAIQFGNEGLLRDILPIVDNIERLQTYSYQESSWKSFQEGIELLLAEIGKTLEKYGVEPIEALGKPFDPTLHEAMQRSETEEVEVNTVLEVYQKGYLYRGRLLRPSLVVVAVSPRKEEEGEGQEEAPAGGGGAEAEEEGTDGEGGQSPSGG